MSHANWSTVLGDIASVQAIAGTVVGSIGTAVYHNYATTTGALLEQCRKDLEEVKARLNELTPERREQIRLAADRGECKSLDKLEQDLLRLSDDRCDLSDRSEKSSCWQRHVPLSQLRDDINQLKDRIRKLRADTYNTSNFPNKLEALRREQARSQSQQSPGHQPSGTNQSATSPPLHSSTTNGSQPTQHRTPRVHQPSGQSEEYPLECVTLPKPIHIKARHDVTDLPSGLV